MSRRTILPGVLVGMLTLSAAWGAEDIDLVRAIDVAIRQNRDLVTLKLALRSSLLGVTDAESEFLLNIRPDGNVGTSDEGPVAQYGLGLSEKLTPGTDLSAGARLVDQDLSDGEALRTGSLRVEVRQPLLKNRGRLVNREPIVQAQSRVIAARRNLELKKADLVVEVVETHTELVRLQHQLDFDEQSVERFNRLYRLTKARERQGRASRVDTLRVEFQRGRAELSLNATREDVQSLRRDFADLLGFPPETEFQAVSSPSLEIELPEAEEATRVAFSNRLDYAQALQDLRDASRGVRIAHHNLLPDVDVVARYERLGDGTDFSDATHLDEDIWFVGLAGDTDLFRRSEKTALGKAQIDEETAEQQIDIINSALRRQVQQALLAYTRARNEVSTAERNYSLARDRARLARRLFEIGRGDNFTATDAEIELLQAENQMLVSRAESSVSVYRLLRVLGTLIESPEDLKPRRVEGAT